MPRSPKKPKQESRVTLVEAISAPLGFFVLALLIVETFLATVLVWSDFKPEEKMIGIQYGIGLFIYITLVVAVLVWFKPTHLTYDKIAHLRDRGRIPYGTEEERISPAKLFDASEKEKLEEAGEGQGE